MVKINKKSFHQVLVFFCLNAAFGVEAFGQQEAQLTKYELVQSDLENLRSKYPDRVEFFEIGVNDDGTPLRGVKIGSGPLKNLVVATHHGNEYGSTEVARAFAASLAENPIAGQSIYILPVLNVNGYNQKRRQENFKGRLLDPNRDYPGPCADKSDFVLKSTWNLDRFLDREGIVSAATLHTYAPAVMYPWGQSTKDWTPPYLDVWQALVKFATQFNNYSTGNSGQLLYPADGTFEDYAFWKYGTWSLLFEVGYTHSPSPEGVKQLIQENVPGLRLMFENSPLKRADDHEFRGKCDKSLRALDLQLE
jgi:carboxypeptidase T